MKATLAFTCLVASKIPAATCPRIAVLGRSNVGKSSFLNSLTHPHKYFRSGKTPGVTRGLIGVNIRLGQREDSELEIVDTPGYGFAKASSISSDGWSGLLEGFVEQTTKFPLHFFWLVDPRRKPDDFEGQIRDWLGPRPFSMVFSKSDQVRHKERPACEAAWSDLLSEAAAKVLWVSALKGEGFDQVQSFMRQFRRHAEAF